MLVGRRGIICLYLDVKKSTFLLLDSFTIGNKNYLFLFF